MNKNALAIIYVLAGVALLYFLAMPSYADITTKMEEKGKYETAIESISNIEAKKNSILAEMNKLPAEDRSKIDAMVPSTVNMTKLVSDVDSIASKHSLSIRNIIYTQATDTAKPGASVDTPIVSGAFKTNKLSFNFEANYNSMLSFIKDLEASIQVIDVTSLKMVGGSKGVDTYTLEFQTYSIN